MFRSRNVDLPGSQDILFLRAVVVDPAGLRPSLASFPPNPIMVARLGLDAVDWAVLTAKRVISEQALGVAAGGGMQ